MFKVTEQKILEVLRHDTWKTAREIRDELKVNRNSVSGLAKIYVRLWGLEKDRCVERRERMVSSKILAAKRGHPPHEFHLTHDGVRRRAEEDKKKHSRVYGRVPADELAS